MSPNVERHVDAFGSGALARDLDHVGGDVVADRLGALAGGQDGHPARPATELAERDARPEIEQGDDEAEVDHEAGSQARLAAERLDAKPLAADVADPLRVLELRALSLFAHDVTD